MSAGPGPARRHAEPWNDPAALPYVRLGGVSKRFGAATAVDDVSLDIHRGEFFALLGPSGCGKTTLLRLLAGFERPSAGRIEIDGIEMSGVPPYRRPINMMFQSYALFPHMTVGQNVAFGLRQERLPRAEIARRVAEMLELVQLAPLARRKPHQLSGGERQRVALARSLAKQPKLLLLDEPLAALDKRLREETQFELMNIQERVGITFIIVTHDQHEAMALASRIAVMDRGRIAQVGTPAEIYETPNSRYVAGFVGDVNLFEGRVIESGADHVRIRAVEDGAEFLIGHALDRAAGATVWVALRPEKLDIAPGEPFEAGANSLCGRVWDIGYLGGLSVYRVKLPSGRLVTSTRINRTRLPDQPIGWGDPVCLTWAPGAAIVLPA